MTQDGDDDVMFMGVESSAHATPPAGDDADDLPTLESSDVRYEELMDDEDEATDDAKPRMHGTATPPSPLRPSKSFRSTLQRSRTIGRRCDRHSSDGHIPQEVVATTMC